MSLLDGKQAAPEQKPEPNGPIVHMGRPVQLVIDVLVDPSFVPLLYSQPELASGSELFCWPSAALTGMHAGMYLSLICIFGSSITFGAFGSLVSYMTVNHHCKPSLRWDVINSASYTGLSLESLQSSFPCMTCALAVPCD